MNRYKKLISNTLVLGAGTFASKLIVLLMMPFYTKLLSPDQFGTADLVAQTANMIIPLACIGICEGLFRFTLDTEDKKGIFSTSICALTIGTLCMFLVLPLLNLFGALDGYVIVIGLYVACANFHSAAAQYLRAQGRNTLFAVQGMINTVLTVLLNILFLWVFELGALGYVLSVVFGDLIVTAFLVVWARLYRDFSPKSFNKLTLRELLKFSLPYIPTTMMWLITSVSDRYIVRAFCGADETGLYAASYKIPTLLTLAAGVFVEAWQFSAVKDSTREERGRFFGSVYRSYIGVIFVAASVLIGGSKIFTEILLDQSYYSSWTFVPVLVGATIFSTLVSFLGSVYFVEKKSLLSMFTALTGAIINVILNFILIPEHAAMGAAVATLISYLAVYVIRLGDTKNYVRFDTHNLLLVLNCGLLVLQSAIIYSGVRHHMLMQVAMIVIIALVNLKGIIVIIKEFLGFLPFIKNKGSKKNINDQNI